MEVTINLDKKDISYVMKLASVGCKEILNYPELCELVDKTNGEGTLYNYLRDYDEWSRFREWEKGCTPVHALGFACCFDILDYPQYLKVKNKNGTTPLHFLTKKLLIEDKEVLDKILKIDGLEKLKNNEGVTPLHTIASLGYVPILNYPGIEKIESPEFNTHGNPMTLLYHYATEGLDTLLSHPDVMTEYKQHGSPLYNLQYNKIIRPSVKKLREHGFKMNSNWHSSKC